jgi:hypothetical protein
MSLAEAPDAAPAEHPLGDARPAVRRGPVRRLLREYRYTIGVWAWSRALTFFGVAFIGWIGRPRGAHGVSHLLPPGPLGLWDGQWYILISKYGYDPMLWHGNAPAFFPLYPFLIGLVHLVAPVSNALLGVLLSTVLLLPALMVLYRLTLSRWGEGVARRTVLYLSISPMAFVFSAVYTESLALLLTVSSFLMLERRRILAASVLGSLAVLTRPVGILIAPAIAWRVFQDEGRRFSWRLVWRLTPVLLMPLALLGFQSYLWWRTGQPLATNAAEERGWSRSPNPLYVLALPIAALHGIWIMFDNHDMGLALSAFAACAYFWLLFLLARTGRAGLEYLIYGFSCLVLPAATGMWLGFPRFGLVIFPIFWMLALLGRNERFDTALKTAMPAMMMAMLWASYVVVDHLGGGTFTP